MGSPSVMDEVRKVMAMVTEGNEQLQQAQEQASAAIRETTAAARQQMAVMEAAASEQLLEAKASLEVAREVYTQYEDVFFHHLKRPRKMLYRATFGRFQTPEVLVESAELKLEGLEQLVEVLVESAERKLEGLKQSVEVFKNDTKKLQVR
ncbi:unnamed protein product [Closterium sp. NIES-64]|nr:unnamed protein product [Closterium sp. NIES-64]